MGCSLFLVTTKKSLKSLVCSHNSQILVLHHKSIIEELEKGIQLQQAGLKREFNKAEMNQLTSIDFMFQSAAPELSKVRRFSLESVKSRRVKSSSLPIVSGIRIQQKSIPCKNASSSVTFSLNRNLCIDLQFLSWCILALLELLLTLGMMKEVSVLNELCL